MRVTITRLRRVWGGALGIAEFTVLVLSAFLPIYLGVLVGALVPLGGFRDHGTVALSALILIAPALWMIVTQPIELLVRVGIRSVTSTRGRSVLEECVESAASYVVLTLTLRLVFERVGAAALAALVGAVFYHLFGPMIERGYESSKPTPAEGDTPERPR